jgi:hypothetical protein
MLRFLLSALAAGALVVTGAIWSTPAFAHDTSFDSGPPKHGHWQPGLLCEATTTVNGHTRSYRYEIDDVDAGRTWMEANCRMIAIRDARGFFQYSENGTQISDADVSITMTTIPTGR